jgi:hypothetical protein
MSARLFTNVIRVPKPILLRDCLGSNSAAADAFADKDRAGIGGWFLLHGDALKASALHWFSVSLLRDDLPDWFDCQSLQSGITALEALAQIILLLMQVQFGHLPKQLVTSLPQMCDKHRVVAGSAKMLSDKLMFACPCRCWDTTAASTGSVCRSPTWQGNGQKLGRCFVQRHRQGSSLLGVAGPGQISRCAAGGDLCSALDECRIQYRGVKSTLLNCLVICWRTHLTAKLVKSQPGGDVSIMSLENNKLGLIIKIASGFCCFICVFSGARGPCTVLCQALST